jgi:hypothetical protein
MLYELILTSLWTINISSWCSIIYGGVISNGDLMGAGLITGLITLFPAIMLSSSLLD